MTSPKILEQLAAYVPTPVAQAIYQQPQILSEPTFRRCPAVILFSDISGFTKLSELLGNAGPAGAEELTHLINQYFTEMIQISQSYHGQVVKFSGDALTVLFPAEDVAMPMAVRWAGECALAMQKKVAWFSTLKTSQGTASLTMKVAIGAGEILECSVGGVLGRWEYVVAGEPLVQVAMAQDQAQPGQVVLSASVWEHAQNFFAGDEFGQAPHFARLLQPFDPLSKIEPQVLDWAQIQPQQRSLVEKALECFVPGAIKDRLGEQSGWLAELRRMTIVFIGIGGFDYKASDAGQQVQNFLQATQELVYRFEGSLNKVAVDDKGTILLILFGAPPFSHEDNPTRAVAFSLDLQMVAREQGLRMAIGITEGTIFAGPVGAPNRREYTVIGDQVNLAARLMQHGKAGTIIISERVKERAGSHFVTESLGEISLKGKAQSQKAYLVKGEQGVQEEFMVRYLLHDDPLVGREAELAQIGQIAAQAWAGQLQLLFIDGELGLGKSRLASEIVRRWIMDGGVGYGGKCVSYDRQIIYRVWREVLAAIYGLTPNLSPQRQLARLAAGIAELEDPLGQPDYWAKRIPLLADVIGLDIPDNDFTQTISGQLRRNNTFALIEALLRQEAARRPLLILLEDIHWADELSLSLAAYLAKKLTDSSLLLVLIHRPMPVQDLEPLASIKNLPYAHSLKLDLLSESESKNLINILANGVALPDGALEILLSRGQGNPFFLQEIFEAISSVTTAQSIRTQNLPHILDLPVTVQDAILTHVDRLAEAEKLTLKVASVIGTRFQRSLLANVHPVGQTGLVLSSQLTKLENEKLIRLESPAPKWEYDFYNVTVQEVVYEGLLLAQRRQLHEAVGKVLEELIPDEIEQLAFHFSRSGNQEKALYYLRAAAEKAKREYANQAAIDYYSEILTYLFKASTADNVGHMISTDYWDTVLERAKLYHLIGQRDKELEDLGTLGVIAEALEDNYRRAQAAKQWACFYETNGDYDSGLEMIERSVQLAQAFGDEVLVGEGYNLWGNLLHLKADYKTAHDYLQQALIIAQKYHNKSAQADCLHSLGAVAHHQADDEVALYFFEEAIVLRRELGDQLGLANSLTFMGQVHYSLGQFMAAQHCFYEALTLHQTIGDRAGEALAQLNLGQVRRSLGDYESARVLLEMALNTNRSIEDRRHLAYTLYHLGFLYVRLEHYNKAEAMLVDSLLILREMDDFWAIKKALTYYAWTLIKKEEFGSAQKCLEEALKIERDVQRDSCKLEILAHLGYIAWRKNDLSLANTCIEHILKAIKEQGIKGIEHPMLVILRCYQILNANGALKQTRLVLEMGRDYLQRQAAQINDPELRQYYLSNIMENQEVHALAAQIREHPFDRLRTQPE